MAQGFPIGGWPTYYLEFDIMAALGAAYFQNDT